MKYEFKILVNIVHTVIIHKFFWPQRNLDISHTNGRENKSNVDSAFTTPPEELAPVNVLTGTLPLNSIVIMKF